MTLFQSILLGIVQGLSEFLPISSSAHLVIVPYLLGWRIPEQPAFVFNVLVQVATLAGVFAYFWADLTGIAASMLQGLRLGKPLGSPLSRLGWLIVLATIPAGLAGLLVKDLVEAAFASPAAASGFLLVTAALLLVVERMGKRQQTVENLSWLDALLIGVFQALAVFPGISRSGSTIAGGMLRGLQRPAAARFAFLMSVPIMLAAGLLALLDLRSVPGLSSLLPVFIPGFLISAVTGYLSIRWLLHFVVHRPLYVFSVYCVLLSAITLASLALR